MALSQVGAVGLGFYDALGAPPINMAVIGAVPGTNGILSFKLIAPRPQFVLGAGFLQIIRLIAGPVAPTPGTPVEAQFAEAQLGFLDVNGRPIGPTSKVILKPGETQSLDLVVREFAKTVGSRIEVQPVVTVLRNAGEPSALTQLPVTVQVLDAATGFETVLFAVPEPGASSPPLVPQVLTAGQTMRFNVVAGDTNPCAGRLSFADINGHPLGPSMPLDLGPGAGTSLNLDGHALGLALGERIEVQPIVSVTPAVRPRPPLESVCQFRRRGVRPPHRAYGNIPGNFGSVIRCALSTTLASIHTPFAGENWDDL